MGNKLSSRKRPPNLVDQSMGRNQAYTTPDQPQTPSLFRKFPLLPTELRLMIWHFAHNNFPGRIVQITPQASLTSGQITIRASGPPSPLLHTNIESRLEFLKERISPFSRRRVSPVSKARCFLDRDMRSLLYDPKKDTLFLSDAYRDFLEVPYTCLPGLLSDLFSGSAAEVMRSMCRLAVPRVAYTSGFFSDRSDTSRDLPSNKKIRELFPNLEIITLQYGVATEKLKGRDVVDFKRGFEGKSGEVSELMICYLDDERTKVEPWFVAEHMGWCPGTIIFEEKKG
ncbi:hypothetical protein BJ875DRAFT_461332 [Amylocarpus encephaloides]|uniref:2EXR domain-containing protein n=1 Tax=Amylocarpus encephaloides TaxID=45428 RepID=A0A9P7YJ46_9HELO|nr:hypothetical protein BJ875DRAFT_461332 [Amylocarpus encephaloides]